MFSRKEWLKEARRYLSAAIRAVVGPAEIVFHTSEIGARPFVALTVGEHLPLVEVPSQLKGVRRGDRVLFGLADEEWEQVRARVPQAVVTRDEYIPAANGLFVQSAALQLQISNPGADFEVDESGDEPRVIRYYKVVAGSSRSDREMSLEDARQLDAEAEIGDAIGQWLPYDTDDALRGMVAALASEEGKGSLLKRGFARGTQHIAAQTYMDFRIARLDEPWQPWLAYDGDHEFYSCVYAASVEVCDEQSRLGAWSRMLAQVQSADYFVTNGGFRYLFGEWDWLFNDWDRAEELACAQEAFGLDVFASTTRAARHVLRSHSASPVRLSLETKVFDRLDSEYYKASLERGIADWLRAHPELLTGLAPPSLPRPRVIDPIPTLPTEGVLSWLEGQGAHGFARDGVLESVLIKGLRKPGYLVRALSNLHAFRTVTSLEIEGGEVSAEDFRGLSASALTKIGLIDISTRELDVLASVVAHIRPQKLKIQGLALNNRCLEQMGPNVVQLTLDGTLVTAEGLGPLAQLEDLTFVDADDSVLRAAARLNCLKSLHIVGANVTDAGIEELAGHPTLEALILVRTSVTGACFQTLASVPNLTILRCGGFKFTAADAKALATAPSLTDVALDDVESTDEAVIELGELRTINKYYITGSGFSNLVGEQLAARLSDADVSVYGDD